MLKIIHISDFHLESQYPSHDKIKIVDTLAKDLCQFVDTSTILFFTGDLIDKGGEGFKEDAGKAFDYFDKFFIEPIVEKNPILKNRIFIVPGNHDVFRSKIDPVTEGGLKNILTSEKSVDQFIESNRNNPKHLERIIDYKIWEKKFYEKYTDSNLTLFENTFLLKVNDIDIGITCLNSTWLCKDKNDKENLIIGKNQIQNSLTRIAKCKVKLALSHHPLEFLTEFDREPVKIALYNNYDILFTGHVHELDSSYTQNLYGTLFISIANSTIGDNPEERRHINGYTIIELSPNEKIKTLYRRYVESVGKFVPNTEIGTDDGAKEFPFLKDEKLTKFEVIAHIVDGIENRFCDKLNEDLIMSVNSTNTPFSIDSIFVEPTILNYPKGLGKEEDVIHYSIESVLTSDANFLVYGLKEAGKTILLDKFFLEAIRKFNQFNKIPIHIKFNDFKNKEIDKVLKEYFAIPNSEVVKLLSENNSIMFVDDLSFLEKNNEQITALKNLVIRFPRMQIVATIDQLSENKFPTDYLEHNDVLNFEIGFIQNLNTHEIKELIGKWFSGKEVDFQENMERLLKSFVDFGLPKTPLSVTMFLWIFEKQEKKPLNNSVLVEMFIENLLEKTSIENIYSDTFDFKNKQRLLSFISKFMKDSGDEDLSYSVNYVDLLSFSSEYLKSRFTGKPQKVIDDLIRRGILCYEDDNLVRFKSAFFFHYFLALYFSFDNNFKMEVLTEENYLDYTEEIGYYSGLKRDDIEILNFTQSKLHEAFQFFNDDVIRNYIEVDNVLETVQKSQTLTFRIPHETVEIKPTEDQLEKVYDHQLSSIPEQKNIPKKSGNDYSTKKNPDLVLKLAANVLKNSEDVDDFNAKKIAYKNILTSSISLMMYERNELIIAFNKYQKKPANLPKNIDFNVFINIIPLVYQVILYNWLGSQKLRPVITDKIGNDKLTLNISEFEKFLSVFTYSDVRGIDYPEIIESFVSQLKHNYLKDLSFLKILSYYHLRNNTKELENKYLKILSEIKEDLGQIDKKKKSQFILQIKESKRARKI